MPIFNEFLRRNSMAPNTKRVCVVGAGAAGLCAVKECLHQGLQPVGYEMDDDLGGVWRRAEEGEPVLKPMMYDNLVTNTTKWTMSYSDFPPLPQDTPIYTRKTLLAYYERYADHFNLRQYIVFNTRIMKIKRAPSYERTGQWLVHIALVDREGNPVEGQNMQTELFDCVIVCNGYFRSPRYPTNLPGRDTFPGFQEHSMTYRNNEKYRGKNVLVVGNKFSAIDIANDVANVASQTYLAVGSGTWIIPRLGVEGTIMDRAVSRKGLYSAPSIQHAFNEGLMAEANARLDHEATGVRSDVLPFNGPCSLQDSIQVKILSGQVIVYGYVTELNKREAVFDDGQRISDLDAVVYCTGYDSDFSFLDENVRPATHSEDGGVEMYKFTFPMTARHNTLAVVGHYGSDSAMLPPMELQCRLATRVMSGKYNLPAAPLLKKDVEYWNKISWSRKKSKRNPVVPLVHFSEEMAQVLGVYPHFWTLFFKDPRLAYRTWAGPWFPASYRLLGPDSTWEEARRTCHQMYEEDLSMVCHRKVKPLAREKVRRLSKYIWRGFYFLLVPCLLIWCKKRHPDFWFRLFIKTGV